MVAQKQVSQDGLWEKRAICRYYLGDRRHGQSWTVYPYPPREEFVWRFLRMTDWRLCRG